MIPWFARRYDLDLDEAVVPAQGFANLHQLFTRALTDGARPVAKAPLVSPADGVVAQCGRVQQGQLIQAKGKTYSAEALIGSELTDPDAFDYATIYLSPHDYHRLHSPAAMTVNQRCAVPGTLWPVNPISVAEVDRLFCVNERVALRAQVGEHTIYVVLVGATIVGGIKLTFDATYSANTGAAGPERVTYSEPHHLAAGAPLGHFEFGSTAIVLWPRALGQLAVASGDAVRVGEALAR
jgi:phosphatidylserine decarboxylase